MSRMARSRPPGVSRRMISPSAPLFGGLVDALDDVFGNGRRDGGVDRDHVEDRRLFAAGRIGPDSRSR